VEKAIKSIKQMREVMCICNLMDGFANSGKESLQNIIVLTTCGQSTCQQMAFNFWKFMIR
jgi:hypothetical protein